MIEAFLSVFAVAFVLTIYSFIILEEDMKSKSYRPAYLLFIAIIAWLSTIGLLITPSSTVISIAAYNVVTSNVPLMCNAASCGTTTEVAQYPAYNQTTRINTPVPTYAFYEYMAFAGGMATLCLIFFIMFLMKMSVTEITDAGKDLLQR